MGYVRTGDGIWTIGFALAAMLAGLTVDPAMARQLRCDDGSRSSAYLTETIPGVTPEAIARTLTSALTFDEPSMREALERAVIAVESQRLEAARTAEVLAGDWDDWRAKHMNRDEFVRRFNDEAAARRRGSDAHASVLEAAQVMQNVLDDLHGAAGSRPDPRDPMRMWWWDTYLRREFAADAITPLLGLPDGKAYWNEFLIQRRSAIECAVARYAPPNGATPASQSESARNVAEAESDGAKVAISLGALLLWALTRDAEGGQSQGIAGRGSENAPACRQEFNISPSRRPCGQRWRANDEWPKRYWCYTDFNVRIGGKQGVTYCTDGRGTWEHSSPFNRCNEVEGWCD